MPRSPSIRSALVALLAAAAAARAQEAGTDELTGALREAVFRPVLEDTCFDCHAGAEPKARLDLTRLGAMREHDALALALRIRDRVLSREMPPSDWGELDDAEIKAIADWADGAVAARLPALELDPGRVTVRRLSRAEWENAVRDLFGVATDASARFPSDDLGYGFDNVGDAASFSQLHAEKYLAAASEVAARVVELDTPEQRVQRKKGAALAMREGNGDARGDAMSLSTNGVVRARFEVPRPGPYRVVVYASGDQAGDEPVRMTVGGAGREARFDVEGERRHVAAFPLDIALEKRRVTIDVAFTNDFYDPDHPDEGERDRNLVVHKVELRGPLDSTVPEAARWLAALDPGDALAPRERALPIARGLAARAWRRPPADEEVARLAGLVAGACAAGDSFALGERALLEAVLVSPRFLFRIEQPGDRALDGFEVAARLSFFLWSSTPDERLLARAAHGLATRGQVTEEVRRMLRDPRADALATGFAAQWLELRNLDAVEPDPARFPEFDRELRASMRKETESLFRAVLREGRSVHELLDADFTFLDARLARHYGVDGAFGQEPRRVPAVRRGGVAGHASVLTLTSHPTRTSPVRRGRWILDNLLDAPPPPPQPGNDAFQDEAAAQAPASLREQLARHRANADCAVCHVRMDGLGLALERFDPIGRRREADGEAPIDAHGVLPGGRAIEDLDGLAAVLAADPAFTRALAHKLFVFAIGRAPSADDRLALERMLRALPGRATTLEDLILGITALDAFTRVRAAATEVAR